MFRPEFLNRLDEIVRFRPLGQAEMDAIARKLLSGFAQRLAAAGVDFLPSDQAIRLLAQKGLDPRYGARPCGGSSETRWKIPPPSFCCGRP